MNRMLDLMMEHPVGVLFGALLINGMILGAVVATVAIAIKWAIN